MTCRTRGSKGVDAVMDWNRARSRALIIMGSGTIEEAWLLEEVSISSL